MKNRPLKHKAKNAFQFKSFHERISEVDVRQSVLYYVKHENEELEEHQSYFHQTIQKWSVLNLSDEYQRFHAPVRGIVTLSQLLHKKDFVIERLLTSLDSATELSLQALLEFVVILARDLREDFYRFFERIFDKLICLLSTQNPQQLEWTLLCLASLFKIMRGYLRERLDFIFGRIVTLLCDENQLHITNFATECFGFLARDTKKKRELVHMITSAVKHDPTLSTGCGRLLFEIMRGVNQQFHSCASDFWNLLLLEMLNEPASDITGFDPEVLFDILVQTVSDMLQCIASTNLVPFWSSVYQAAESCVANENMVKNEQTLDYILHLIGIAVEHQHGKCVNNCAQMISLLVKIVTRTKSERVLANVTKIATIIMLSRNLNITQLDASRLCKNVMTIGPRSRIVFEDFVLGMVEYAMFENIILPDYLKYFEKKIDTESLNLLTRIVTKKSPRCRHGIKLNCWKQFPIKIKTDHAKRMYSDLLRGGLTVRNRTDFLLALILLPHLVEFQNDTEIKHLLEREIISILSELNSQPTSEQYKVLSVMVEAFVHIEYDNMQIFIKIIEKLLPVVVGTVQESLINIISLCLVKIHQDKPQLLTKTLFETVHSQLNEFLASVHHKTRLLVTHIFTLFGHLESLTKYEDQTLFDLFYNIETVEPTVHTYREIIMLLNKLEFDSNLLQNIGDNTFRLDAMKFVLSMLSINFKLLWDPVSTVLQSYAVGFAVSDFWSIYKKQLDFALEAANRHNTAQNTENECDFFSDNGEQDEKIDYVNYRVQLLVTLSKLNRVCESKNHDIVEAFLNFIQSEYRIKQNVEPEANEYTPKATQKILIAYMNIFAKVKNPLTIFKSGKLYELFEELLTHRSFDVQKLALDCIFTYSNSATTPYKNNLYRLSSDKTIKEEMLSFFTEDTESENKLRCIVLDEHRQQVVPLVMKIIHTRMIQKVTPTEQKALILRFVGNFYENEINIFISMSFSYFEKLLQYNPLQTHHKINESDKRFEEDLPVHRIQVLMKLIDSIREQFGGLKNESFIRYVLHIKLCMDSILLRMQHSTVKQLKSQALINLVDIFEHFDGYKWTPEEIETIFIIYIQPQLEKLETECIHSPTPLLKLFITWSKNPRYYQLLVKSLSDQQFGAKTTPLSRIISLLNGEKTSDTVCQEIIKMIISMLTLDSISTESETIMVPNSQIIYDDQMAWNDMNLGTYMLMPFIMDILYYIQKVMKCKRSINKDHLLVLSHIAKHVKKEESCDAMTNMLLPIIVRKVTLPNVDMDIIQQMHTALYSLMKMVPNPEKHLHKIGLLLELVQDSATRAIIVQMVKLIAEKSGSTEHTHCATILEDMNAMDKRWLDQPDYERRLGAFRSIDRIMQSDELCGMDLTVLFVHQCFYYLKTDTDLAIRDNTNHFLRKVTISSIKKFGTNKKAETQYLLERVILIALMKGIKDKNNVSRNESIQLLGELSRECAEYSTILSDLYPFTDSQNREIDFFDNITHLQIHRHRRALNRFCKTAQNLTGLPSTRTLVNFVLPIVSSYLCNEAFRKKVRLTDAAGNCVALIARMLPWPNYKALLKQYLFKMKHNIEYQKQLIRLVVSLLDHFHFDLSRANLNQLQDIGGLTQLKTTLDAVRDTIDDDNIAPPCAYELDDDDNNEEEDHINRKSSAITSVKISFTCKTVLTKENADIVMYDISRVLIPSLFSVINYKEIPDSIKPNERKERYQREKGEMLKIPVAIAIVKLLQKLPSKFMDLNFPKLLIKVVSFLKSNLKQVRSIARHTLKNMLLSVGPSVLNTVLEYLTAILSRGFQVHVMVATVHTLLDAVNDKLTAEIVDDILQSVLSICINDIFGPLAKEKEVGSVASKTPEAKPNKKSFLTLQILAKKMSESSALDMIMPFKEIITKTNSRKAVLKVEEALRKIADGFCSNTNISIESMLVFVYGITSESIPDLVCRGKKTHSEKQENKMREHMADIYLIPAEPKRRGAFNQIPFLNRSKTNAHVFVEMGLEILHSLMKKSQVLSLDYKAILEPLVPILVNSMSSNHMKVTTLGIKCLSSLWSSKLNLSNVEQNIETIVDNLLKLLHKYATTIVGRNDANFQMVKTTFKAIVTLLKHVKYFEISNAQLKMLLLYVEQDLYHNEKQNMTLILLRSIVGRKLIASEMVSIIKRVAELSITHDSQKIREECRQIVLEYLLNYSLGKNIEHIVHFYIRQLEYEVIAGRESAVQMLRMMFKSFPARFLAIG
ncbi:small subunit processome component 20 homolog isoform X2 [Ochlerotatus camptorhynchus]|uniref:small subunit processome component 20 homolog isoform X2 n=1 Tax=Ochlerotatus camptorhynchus TaxID=644619 RepID=UPI0031DB3CC2